MPKVLESLLKSRRFWLAGVAFAVTAAKVAFPQIPAELVTTAQTFVVILISAYTIDDTVATLKGN